MDGTYQNAGYGNGSINNGNYLSLTSANKATLDGPLNITNAPGHTPKIIFDGSGGIIGTD